MNWKVDIPQLAAKCVVYKYTNICIQIQSLEQRFPSRKPLALTRKSLIYIRYYRTSLVLYVQVERIKAMFQKLNSSQLSWGIKVRKFFSLEMELQLLQVKHLYFWYFWAQKTLFPMWSVPDVLPGLFWAKKSDLRRSWSAASHHGSGDRRAAGWWIWGWAKFCMVPFLGL